MLKRLTLSLVLGVLTIAMMACTPTESTSIEDELDAEYDRIEELVPYEFKRDRLLPAASDGYDVTYIYEEEVLEDRWLHYEVAALAQYHFIDVILSKDNVSQTYELILRQEGDPEEYEAKRVDAIFDDVFTSIDEQLPDVFVSNVSVPVVQRNDIAHSITTNCGDIERGRIEYSFPENDVSCQITATVAYGDIIRSHVYETTLSAVDNLPRVPEVHITTDGGAEITSKDFYVDATITVSGTPDQITETLENMPIRIRLRGNSTLWMPKRSFKIKFEEQVRFLTDYADKDWVLLANFADQTLVRNTVAFNLSERLGMTFTPSIHYADVYVNGEYMGNYMITDQIEVTKDRVDIEENVDAIDTGYLIELDWGFNRGGDYSDNHFYAHDVPFVLHSPEEGDDHYMSAHKDYIRDYMNDLFDTLENRQDYTHLIDEASFIDWFIVSELFKNVDSGYSSVYFYKEKGGLLYMGPLWDFDLSSGNQGHLQPDLRVPEGWYTTHRNILFSHLMQYDEFTEHLTQRWNEIYDTAILPVLDDIWIEADAISHSRYRNFERWDIIGENNEWYTADEVYDLKTYDEQVWFLYDYLEIRMQWLNEAMNDL